MSFKLDIYKIIVSDKGTKNSVPRIGLTAKLKRFTIVKNKFKV